MTITALGHKDMHHVRVQLQFDLVGGSLKYVPIGIHDGSRCEKDSNHTIPMSQLSGYLI